MTSPAIGLIPILATPFHDDGRLDLASLHRLVEFEKESGVDALAVFGMASEGFALGIEDRSAILDAVRESADGLPIIAGVSATGLPGALDQVAAAAAGGAHTVMVTPPHMIKPSPAQTVEFFGIVADHAAAFGLDVMIQDAPAATGVEMSADTLAQICAVARIASIKIEAPPTLVKFDAVAPAAEAAGTALLGGMNAQFVLDEYARGAVGTMPACEFSDLLRPILDQWVAGDLAGARAGYARLLPLLIWGLQPGIAYAVHKEILVHRGLISSSAVRIPARPVTPAMRLATIELYEAVVSEVVRG